MNVCILRPCECSVQRPRLSPRPYPPAPAAAQRRRACVPASCDAARRPCGRRLRVERGLPLRAATAPPPSFMTSGAASSSAAASVHGGLPPALRTEGKVRRSRGAGPFQTRCTSISLGDGAGRSTSAWSASQRQRAFDDTGPRRRRRRRLCPLLSRGAAPQPCAAARPPPPPRTWRRGRRPCLRLGPARKGNGATKAAAEAERTAAAGRSSLSCVHDASAAGGEQPLPPRPQTP